MKYNPQALQQHSSKQQPIYYTTPHTTYQTGQINNPTPNFTTPLIKERKNISYGSYDRNGNLYYSFFPYLIVVIAFIVAICPIGTPIIVMIIFQQVNLFLLLFFIAPVIGFFILFFARVKKIILDKHQKKLISTSYPLLCGCFKIFKKGFHVDFSNIRDIQSEEDYTTRINGNIAGNNKRKIFTFYLIGILFLITNDGSKLTLIGTKRNPRAYHDVNNIANEMRNFINKYKNKS